MEHRMWGNDIGTVIGTPWTQKDKGTTYILEFCGV